MNKFKCVLFDLDGVLVDACDWHYEALNQALEKKIGFKISYDEHIKKYNGLPTRVKLKMLGLDSNISNEIEKLKQEITLDIISNNAKFMPEKNELHTFLKKSNVLIGCVTNSIKNTAELMLKKTGQFNFIDLLISNEDVNKNKPDPYCYNLAVKKLNVDPSYCLCVEDSLNGIQAAKQSSIPNIWIVKNSSEVNLNNYNTFIKRK